MSPRRFIRPFAGLMAAALAGVLALSAVSHSVAHGARGTEACAYCEQGVDTGTAAIEPPSHVVVVAEVELPAVVAPFLRRLERPESARGPPEARSSLS